MASGVRARGHSRASRHGFQRRLELLPADTRRLLGLAAADPVGDPWLVWRAAERLGIGAEAATAAVDAGLFEIGAQVRFRHPSVRSAAYRSASPEERHAWHAALADATDPQLDPDRRAWHRAQATSAPDEAVAEELERSAGRALARGGIAAAAAFLENAATLTPDRAVRARRLLAAARAQRDAGTLDAALALLAAVEAGPVDALQAAEIEQLRGEIAFDQRRVGEAARLLVSAARRFDALDARLARTTHLKALGAGMWAGPDRLREAAVAARAAPPASGEPGAVDLLVDAFAIRVTEGYAAAEPTLRRALDAVLALEVNTDIGRWLWLTGARAGAVAAVELWDADAFHALITRHVQVARDMGAIVLLQFGLQSLVRVCLLAGDLAAAGQAIEEVRAIAEATGTSPVADNDVIAGGLARPGGADVRADRAPDGRGKRARNRPGDAVHDLRGGGAQQRARPLRRRARCGAAGVRARRARLHAVGGARAGRGGLADRRDGARRGRPRADVRAHARGARTTGRSASKPASAHSRPPATRPSVSTASRSSAWPRTRARVEHARARLLYGEWLRREGRRIDAREQLRVARESLMAMGADAFAERARHELLATGEKVRKRRDDTRDELTPQEQHIARLARDGLTNPEIGAELFLSPRTVEWHLKKVFTKLGISSRRALRDALPREPEPAPA